MQLTGVLSQLAGSRVFLLLRVMGPRSHPPAARHLSHQANHQPTLIQRPVHACVCVSVSVCVFYRTQIPNGIMTSEQLRYTADAVDKYDPSVGVLDITTRMALQLRGVTLEDSSDIINKLYDLGLTSLMTCVFCGIAKP